MSGPFPISLVLVFFTAERLRPAITPHAVVLLVMLAFIGLPALQMAGCLQEIAIQMKEQQSRSSRSANVVTHEHHSENFDAIAFLFALHSRFGGVRLRDADRRIGFTSANSGSKAVA